MHPPGRARLAAVAALLIAGAARADGAADRQAATRLQAEGLRLLDRHDAAAALDKFRAAYALVPSYKVLFNLGRAHQELGHRAEAFDCFDQFLSEAADVPPESRADAELFRSQLRSRLAFVDAVGPDGARVLVDGQDRAALPLVRPLPVEPGTHLVALSRDGTALVERRLYLTAGAQLRVAADPTGATPLGIVTTPVPDLGPAPAPQAAPQPAPLRLTERAPAPAERPITARWWFWAGVAVVVVGGVVATAAATGAFSQRAGCPSGFTSCK